MAQLKFAVYNAEWMNELFEGDDVVTFRNGDTEGHRTGQKIADRRTDLSALINHVRADIWTIVEGPNRTEELQFFFDQDSIDGTWLCAVEPTGIQSQGIAVRVDEGKFADTPMQWHSVKESEEAKSLKKATDPFQMDTDGDGLDEVHKFHRRPLYASIFTSDQKEFRVLGLHLKSKGIFDALEWSKWWLKADGNRKKLVAQCYQIRTKFLDEYLLNDSTKDIPMIVCGDINDGPGFDTSEMKLASSGIETLMGSIWKPHLCLSNALYDSLSDKKKKKLDFSEISTASFKDPIINNIWHRPWIDHILYTHKSLNWISGADVPKSVPADDPDERDNPFYRAFPTASDHYPVTCTINL